MFRYVNVVCCTLAPVKCFYQRLQVYLFTNLRFHQSFFKEAQHNNYGITVTLVTNSFVIGLAKKDQHSVVCKFSKVTPFDTRLLLPIIGVMNLTNNAYRIKDNHHRNKIQ